MAVHLRKKGRSVCLAGTPDHQGIIPELRKNGNKLIEVDGSSGLHHESEGVTVKVNIGNIAQAVLARIIIVAVPISAQEDVVKALSCHNLSGRILIFMPCGIAAGLVHTAMSKQSMPKIIVGTVSSPFASRTRGKGKIAITRTKKQLEIGSSERTTAAFRRSLASLFPQKLVWYPNLASIFFSNVNPVIHPATMLVSKEVIANSNPALYSMRNACPPLSSLLRQWTMRDANWPIFSVSKQTRCLNSFGIGRRAPLFNHRYLIEDVKFLLVLKCGIAAKAPFSTPNFNRIISEASDVLGEDLWKTGTTLDSLGFGKCIGRSDYHVAERKAYDLELLNISFWLLFPGERAPLGTATNVLANIRSPRFNCDFVNSVGAQYRFVVIKGTDTRGKDTWQTVGRYSHQFDERSSWNEERVSKRFYDSNENLRLISTPKRSVA
ncbi:vitopine synthase [Gracilaria domingensis]|nr:vitopine synthase [Gracilaria domingensis]